MVDHHQHLLSPFLLAVLVPPPLPTASLPPALQQVLKQHERGLAAPRELYSDDIIALDSDSSNWIRGLSAFRTAQGKSDSSYRLIPNGYAQNGALAYITGTRVNHGDGFRGEVANFMLGLKRVGPAWKISVDQTTAKPPPALTTPITADQLIAEMDAAGVRRAVVLSSAYAFGSPQFPKPLNEAEAVRDENDWTEAEVARYPDRLVGFCGLDPLKDYALQELERCSNLPHMKGLKLHFAASDVDVRKADHLRRLRTIFAAANTRRLPIAAHIWVPKDYGREQAEIFLNEILPVAPDITVQIAHFAGTGPGFHKVDNEALGVFAERIAAGDPRTRNLYFDVATNVIPDQPDDVRDLIVRRFRQIGLRRILFGSDGIGPSNLHVGPSWAAFRLLPLSDDEFRFIAQNVAPYLK